MTQVSPVRRLFRRVTTPFSTAYLVMEALWTMGLGWLIPLFLLMYLVAGFAALLGAAGPLSPFIYPLL